jgi:uncharacterized small protein (DUF1192 family)
MSENVPKDQYSTLKKFYTQNKNRDMTTGSDVYREYDIERNFLDGQLTMYLVSDSSKAKAKADKILSNIVEYKKINELKAKIVILKDELKVLEIEYNDRRFLAEKFYANNKDRIKNNRRVYHSKQGFLDEKFSEKSNAIINDLADLLKEKEELSEEIKTLESEVKVIKLKL